MSVTNIRTNHIDKSAGCPMPPEFFHSNHLPESSEREISINSRFKSIFSRLEEGHIRLRNRLNSLEETGEALEKQLYVELKSYDPWRFELMDELARIAAHFDERERRKCREYIAVSEYFNIVQEAPFYWRIINKPNGYAGDAQMMSFIYRNDFEGPTPFARFLHKHAVSTKACQAVRNRKTYLRKEIIRRNGGKILSLAAGPAQEIMEVLNIYRDNGYTFVALDHDMDTLKTYDIAHRDSRFRYALANAFQIISGNYMTARPRRIMEKFCHPRTDFKGLNLLWSSIKYDLVFMQKEEFDLVYSAGLYDYIKTFPLDDGKGTVALTKNLFELVKPGGALIVGNFSNGNPGDLRFVMEYIYDWQLIHRNERDMFDFARAIPESQIENIEIVREPLGINYFLKIRKTRV
ncbi:MAG TPA: hypothetical protein ENO00_11830 [Deltaproteobacteria bacterium]|nr:hypothetical protein [Deltaproteobacteria bacterium]